MSSEEFHLSQGARPGEKTTPEGFIVPESALGDKNIRDRHAFDDSGDVSQEDAPYEEETISQPRRVRTNEAGQTERLVKHGEGDFSWELIEASAEKTTHDQVLEEVAKGLEGSERNDARQDEEITGLRDEISSLRESLEGRDAEIAQLKADMESLRSGLASGEVSIPSKELDVIEAEIIPDTPGSELELASVDDSEIEDAEEVESGVEYAPPEELVSALKAAMGDYAKETARARKGYLGHLLHDSKYLVKIPGLQKLADKINKWADKGLDGARDTYKSVVEDMQQDIQDQYEHAYEESERDEAYEAELRIAKQLTLLQSNADLEAAIVAEREAQSGKSNWLAQKFTQDSPLKGKLAVAGTAAAVGFGLGLFGGKFAGMAGGAVVGGLMGHDVNRRRANVKNEAGETLAAQQSREDVLASREVFKQKYDDEEGGDGTLEDLLRQHEERTAQERKGNRSRIRTTIGIGAAAGGLSGGIGEMVMADAGAQPVVEPQGESTPEPTPEPAPEVVPVEVLQPDPSIGNYEYPWNWAADRFGADGATDALKRLGDLAAQDGHAIQWNGSGYGEWVQVDGASDTQTVLDILSRYAGKL